MKERYKFIVDAILNDAEYLTWLAAIEKLVLEFANEKEENGKITFDHGIKHALRVADLTSKLLTQFGANEDEAAIGYITGLLHDVGFSEGKKDHAAKGARLLRTYLEKFDLTEEEKEQIINATLRHGKANHAEELLDYIIILADKCDYDKTRVVQSKYSDKAYLNMIERNDVNFKDGKLILEYEMADHYDNSVFYTIPKSIDEPFLIGEALGYPVEFFVNGKLEMFEDRSNYSGFVY